MERNPFTLVPLVFLAAGGIQPTRAEEPPVSEPLPALSAVKDCLRSKGQRDTLTLGGVVYDIYRLEVMYALDSYESPNVFKYGWSFMIDQKDVANQVLGVTESALSRGGFMSEAQDPRNLADPGADGVLNHVHDQVWDRVYLAGQDDLTEFQVSYEHALHHTAAICALDQTQPSRVCPGASDPSLLNGPKASDIQSELGRSAVLLIDETGRSFCSGTLIEGDRVLTAGHCIPEGKTAIQVAWPTQKSGEVNFDKVYTAVAKVLGSSDDPDLGLLQLPRNAKTTPLAVAATRDLSTWTHSMGNPNGRAWTLMGQGAFFPVSELDSSFGSKNQAMLPSKPLCWDSGASGGMVVDEENEIVGVIGAQTLVVEMPIITDLPAIQAYLASASEQKPFRDAVQVCDMKRTLEGITPHGGVYKQTVDMTSCK